MNIPSRIKKMSKRRRRKALSIWFAKKINSALIDLMLHGQSDVGSTSMQFVTNQILFSIPVVR